MMLKIACKFQFALLAITILLLASCAKEHKVVIISTNDIHSSIDNFPKLATLVEQIRAENGEDNVLLIDAGDRWTGNPFVDLAERPLYPIVELMNELGYDLGTIGNHEFDWGQALLDERTKQMNFPVICANLDTGTSKLSPMKPYEMIEAGGMKIAFLGLVTNFIDGHPDGKLESFEGMTFPNVYDTAGSYAWLADESDVFVGLTHIGDDADIILAERVPQFGLIIGGHSHTVIDTPVIVGKTVITQTGSKLKYAGVTTITKKGKNISIENHLVELAGIPASPHYQQMVDRYSDNPELHAAIGTTAGEFTKNGVNNLVTDAIRKMTKADVAFYHNGGIRVGDLPEKVSIADLYKIEPFMSEVYTMEMTAGDIKGLIINKFNDNDNPKESHGPDVFPSGMTYEIITDEAGEAVSVRFFHAERKTYKVAMPDYMYKIYKFNKPAAHVETGLQVTGILKEYFKNNSPVKPDNNPRIEIR